MSLAIYANVKMISCGQRDYGNDICFRNDQLSISTSVHFWTDTSA